MDSGEFTKPPAVEEVEKVITPSEFLDLAIDYINASLTPQSAELLKDISDFPDSIKSDEFFSNHIAPSAKQLQADLPKVTEIIKAAMTGKPVEVLVRPAGSFFYLGERIEQDGRPKETPQTKTFNQEDIPDVVINSHRTWENSTRQDATAIYGFAELLGMMHPNNKVQLDMAREKALKISTQTTKMEDFAKKSLAGEPINIKITDGKPSLNIK